MARFPTRGHSKRYVSRGNICPYCGSYHRGGSTACAYCKSEPELSPDSEVYKKDINKPLQGEVIGFIFGIFFGLIGALVCQFLGDRKTRRNGWQGFLYAIPFKVFFVIILIILILN